MATQGEIMTYTLEALASQAEFVGRAEAKPKKHRVMIAPQRLAPPPEYIRDLAHIRGRAPRVPHLEPPLLSLLAQCGHRHGPLRDP